MHSRFQRRRVRAIRRRCGEDRDPHGSRGWTWPYALALATLMAAVAIWHVLGSPPLSGGG